MVLELLILKPQRGLDIPCYYTDKELKDMNLYTLPPTASNSEKNGADSDQILASIWAT